MSGIEEHWKEQKKNKNRSMKKTSKMMCVCVRLSVFGCQ